MNKWVNQGGWYNKNTRKHKCEELATANSEVLDRISPGGGFKIYILLSI